MLRYLPFFIIFAVLISLFSYVPLRRELLSKIGMAVDETTSCCSVNSILSQNGQFDENSQEAIFDNQVVDYPKTSLAEMTKPSFEENSQVLGTTNVTGEEKWIEIDLGKQWLKAYEGSRVVMEYAISSGKWAPTPKGTFNIWYKTRAQSMVGGNKAIGTYYNLPNVPHNLFFYQGYAIHGAYWHNNFGHTMSHGCVNEPLAEAAKIFDWAGPVLPSGQGATRATAENPGTRVYIH